MEITGNDWKDNLPVLQRNMITVLIAKICRVSSQKQSAIMHNPGTNKVTELNNFRTFVNVIKFLRTSISAITPKQKHRSKYLFNSMMFFINYPWKYYRLTSIRIHRLRYSLYIDWVYDEFLLIICRDYLKRKRIQKDCIIP